MQTGTRAEIIQAYSWVLQRLKGTYFEESALPFPKEFIRQALKEELLETGNEVSREPLIVGYFLLEWFLSPKEYALYKACEKSFSRVVDLIKLGDEDVIAREIKNLSNTDIETYWEMTKRVDSEMDRRRTEARSLKPTAA